MLRGIETLNIFILSSNFHVLFIYFYRAKESEENKINCWAIEGSPKKPSSLLDIEAESLMLQQQQNLLV
jgi:hypothetical protein